MACAIDIVAGERIRNKELNTTPFGAPGQRGSDRYFAVAIRRPRCATKLLLPNSSGKLTVPRQDILAIDHIVRFIGVNPLAV